MDLRLLLPAALGWAAVVVLIDTATPVLIAATVLASILAGVAWLLRSRYPVAVTVCLGALVTALLLAATTAQLLVSSAGPLESLTRQRAVVEVEVVLMEDPRTRVADAERGGTRVVARATVRQVTARGARSQVRTPVLLLGDADLGRVRLWERIRLRGRLSPAQPGDRVAALLVVRGRISMVDGAGPVADAAQYVRTRMRDAVGHLPADAAGLLPALVIGDRSLTPRDLTDDMRATGMTHLSAVSGSNISLILGAVLVVCAALRVPRRWRPPVAVLALAGFVVLARPDPSVLRAAVMGVIGLIGMSSSRRSAGAPALSAAIVVLLVIDPWLSRSYGFALSVLATLGLLVFARSWAQALTDRLPRGCHRLAQATAIPLAAQVTCAPVIVLLQGSVSLIGVAANVICAPFVAPTTILGVITALVAAVHVGAASLIAWLAAVPALAIALDAHTLARVPFGTVAWVPGVAGALLLAGLTVLLLLCGPWLLHHAVRRPILPVGLLVLALAAAWPVSRTWPSGSWAFIACDVGQGDALLVASGPGHAVVVDVGEDPERIDACLSRYGVDVIDALVLTHFHADHVLGLPGALNGRHVGALYVTGLADPPENAKQVQQWALGAGVTPQPLSAGGTHRWGEVDARVRWPGHRITDGSPANNASIVLDVRTPRLRMLLLGDIEREAGRAVSRSLRTDPADRPVDIVKVAHHGSSNLDVGLLRQAAAPVAVISVGADNDYGHPGTSTLDLLRSMGAVVLRTDERGDVVIGLDADGLTVIDTH